MERSHSHPPAHARSTTESRDLFTPAGTAIVVAAALALFADSASLLMEVKNLPDPTTALAFDKARSFWPDALVLVLGIAGYRRLAALAAIVVGAFGAWYLGLLSLFTVPWGELGPAFALVLHLLLVAGGVRELLDDRAVIVDHYARALIAPVVTALIWAAAAGVLANAYGAERQRRAAGVAQQQARVVEQRRAVLAAWMRRSTFKDLTDLATCLEHFRGTGRNGRYPRSMAELDQWATTHDDMGCREAFAYARSSGAPFAGFTSPHARVWYVPPSRRLDSHLAAGYSLEVQALWSAADEPIVDNAPGTRSYLIDTTGSIHVAIGPERATPANATLPPCGVSTGDECRFWTPRQRWGLTPGLPAGLLQGPSVAHRRDTVSFQLWFEPLLPSDAVTAIHVIWNTRGDDTAFDVRAANAYAGARQRLTFRLARVYDDSGMQVVRAALTTRDGSTYQYADSVRILPVIALPPQLGVDARGRYARGDFDAELRQAVRNVAAAAAERNLTLADVAVCHVRLRDFDDWRIPARQFHDAAPENPRIMPDIVLTDDLPRGARVRLDCEATLPARR